MNPPTIREVLTRGDLEVRGRIPHASNAVLFGIAALDGDRVPCVYKPVAGERPLWDFPDGTLAQREVAAYEVSEAAGWGLVPVTVLREGPYGEGMCQEWIGPLPDTDVADPPGTDGRRTPTRSRRRTTTPCWRSSPARSQDPAGRPSEPSGPRTTPPRCWCTRTTSGCAGWPSSTR